MSSPAGPAPHIDDTDTNLASVLSADAVHQLRRFRYDNTPSYLRARDAEAPDPEGPPADDREVYDLLVFAARNIGRDFTLPRTLEALRVVKLVPEDIGAAIFAKIEGSALR